MVGWFTGASSGSWTLRVLRSSAKVSPGPPSASGPSDDRRPGRRRGIRGDLVADVGEGPEGLPERDGPRREEHGDRATEQEHTCRVPEAVHGDGQGDDPR